MALPIEDRPPIPTIPGPLTEFIRSLGTPPSDGLPPEARALLEVIAGTESAGKYNVIYGGSTFDDYGSHPLKYVEIKSGPNKGEYSTAAGKYQFIGPTWNSAKRALDLPDFSPESQDKAAWWLAQQRYERDTGRNLLSDLQTGGSQNMRRISGSLRKEWTSLPGGIEQGQNQSRFERTFNTALGSQPDRPVPPLGMASDPPAPRPRFEGATARALAPTAPLPRPRVEMEVAKNRTMPFLQSLPDVQQRPVTPPPALMADAVRSPTLFGDTVGIPDDMMSMRPDGTMDPSYRLYGPDNRMSVGGFGSLLGGRTIAPAALNPLPRPMTSAPGAGLTAAQRTAMTALPRQTTPSIGGVGGANIAGQVQLPRDVVPASVQRDLAEIGTLPRWAARDPVGSMPTMDELETMLVRPTKATAPVPATMSDRLAAQRPNTFPTVVIGGVSYAKHPDGLVPLGGPASMAPTPASVAQREWARSKAPAQRTPSLLEMLLGPAVRNPVSTYNQATGGGNMLGALLSGALGNSGTVTQGKSGLLNSVTQASPYWRGSNEGNHPSAMPTAYSISSSF